MSEPRTRSGKEPNVNSVEKSSKHNGSRLYTSSNPIATLKAVLHTVRHQTLGWLKQDLIASGELLDNKEAIQAKVWADYNAQLIHVRAKQDILGLEYNPLMVIPGRDKDGKFSFCKNVDVPKHYLSLGYLLYAYDVTQSTFKRLRVRGGKALPKQVPHNKGQCVLLDQKFASCLYTVRYFYVEHRSKKMFRQTPKGKARRGKRIANYGTQRRKRTRSSVRYSGKKAGTTQRERRERKKNWWIP
jgi:hypothetical protein